MIGLKTKEVDSNSVNLSNLQDTKESNGKVLQPVELFHFAELSFSDVDISYVPIIDWLLENITTEGVEPYIGNVPNKDKLDNAINKVKNILNGKGINGAISLEKDIPDEKDATKQTVEVKLL